MVVQLNSCADKLTWHLRLAIFRLGSFVREVSLEILRLGTVAWGPSLLTLFFRVGLLRGNSLLAASAWDPSLDSFQLGFVAGSFR